MDKIKRNSKKSFIGSAMLFLAALIWGLAFVAQSEGAKYIGAVTFNGVRFMIGVVTLIPCVFLLDSVTKSGRRLVCVSDRRLKIGITRDEWIGGALCGAVLCAATVLQQFGVELIGSGKSGFLTSIYVVLVPVTGVFFRRRVRLPIWLGVLAALVGVYFISVPKGEGFSLGRGEIFVILSALVFTVHILVIDRVVEKCDGVRISMLQFAFASIFALPGMLMIERPAFADIASAAIPLLYAGVCSCGIAYTLQILGQRRTDPTVASLLMSLESVFSALGGAIILSERMSLREYIGCAVVFAAVIATNLFEGLTGTPSEKK